MKWMEIVILMTGVLLFTGLSNAGRGVTKNLPGATRANLAKARAPFGPGEKLTFGLRWEFIPAGTAILEVLPMEEIDGCATYHFAVTVATNGVLDKIYKVRDRVDAYADATMTRSLLYRKKTSEGRHVRDAVVTFDWKESKVRYSNFGNIEQPVLIPKRTYDPLSVFYAFRMSHLSENSVLEAPVTDGKRWAMGRARIVTRQKIKVPAGVYDCFLVEPDMKDIGGIFKKSKNAKLHVWVTADERRMPVKVSSSVVVGNFVGELISDK